MIRINLLPHREQKRKERRQRFYAATVASIVVGAVVGLAVHLVIAGYIGLQEQRNAFLKSEIAKLDKDIAEIKDLQQQIDALLARKQVIESLQSNRAETVHVFDELVRQLPEGVFLKTIKENGRKITLTGFAQSNARVSTLMRNLDGSPYLASPQLVEVKAGSLNGRQVSDFTLIVTIEAPKAVAKDEAGKRDGK